MIPELRYDAHGKSHDLYIEGVKVLSYVPTNDGGIFIRRVVLASDLPRLQEAKVKVLAGDNRVVVF